MGFDVTVVDQVADEGDSHSPFSSSSIRSALRRGHMAAAARELGYYWTVMGEVVKGDHRGRAIGFPTANIILEEGAEPIRGIYTVRVRDGAMKNSKAWGGAGYFGNRPTFETNRTFLEVHLFDMNEDLYGRTLLVEFIDLIRPDQKFNSVEELVQQMKQDCVQAKARLQVLSHDNPCTAYPLGRAQEDGTDLSFLAAWLVVRCGIKQAVQMHDEVAHLGVVDGFPRLAKPGLVRLRVVGKKSDHIKLREILEINILDVMELAAKDEMNQLFWQERIFSQGFSWFRS